MMKTCKYSIICFLWVIFLIIHVSYGILPSCKPEDLVEEASIMNEHGISSDDLEECMEHNGLTGQNISYKACSYDGCYRIYKASIPWIRYPNCTIEINLDSKNKVQTLAQKWQHLISIGLSICNYCSEKDLAMIATSMEDAKIDGEEYLQCVEKVQKNQHDMCADATCGNVLSNKFYDKIPTCRRYSKTGTDGDELRNYYARFSSSYSLQCDSSEASSFSCSSVFSFFLMSSMWLMNGN